MTQIADAPYIREAEMYGMPPYGDDAEFEEDYDTAKDLNKQIREMIYKVEDLGCDLRQLAEKVGRG